MAESPPIPTEDVLSWTPSQVAEWLSSLPLALDPEVVQGVVTEGIDGGVLDMVDLDVLDKVGVPTIGLQLRILKAIRVLLGAAGTSPSALPPPPSPFLRASSSSLSLSPTARSSSTVSTPPVPHRTLSGGGEAGPSGGSDTSGPYLQAGRGAAEQMIRVAASMAHVSPFNYESVSLPTGWKFAKLNKGVLIFRRSIPGSSSHAFLGKGVVGVPPESVYNVLSNPHSRRFYKKTLKSLEVVVKLSEDEDHCCSIVHAYHVTSRCLMTHARDFCGVMFNGITSSNRCFVSATTAVNHPLCPPMDGVVRGFVKASSWYVEPYGETDSMVTFFSHVEFGGKLPSSVVNVVSVGQPMCIRQLALIMLERTRLTALLQPPLPPMEALSVCREYLTPHEQSEILGFDLIYFAGPYARKRGPTASSLKMSKRVGLDELSVGLLNTGTSAYAGEDAFATSFDTPDGEYALSVHDHIAYRYEVLGMLSTGVTSQVVKALDHKTGTTCAIKMIKSKRVFRHIALAEIGHLNHVARGREAVADRSFSTDSVFEKIHTNTRCPDMTLEEVDAVLSLGSECVGALRSHFEFRGHLCMVFELMSSNALNVVKVNRYSQNLSILALQDMAIQMASGIAFLHALQIVHCDVKPENIVVRNPATTELKVIDLGSATSELSGVRNSQMYIQTRYYRAPEIVMGIPFTSAIDVWSIGCVIAEMYTGRPLFPARHESELLLLIRDVLGPPDSALLRRATRRDVLTIHASGEPVLRDFRNLDPSSSIPTPTSLAAAVGTADTEFIDFLQACLAWNPEDRWPAAALLNHPWLASRFRVQYAPELASDADGGDTSSHVSSNSGMVPLSAVLANADPSAEHVAHLYETTHNGINKEDFFTV